MTWNLRGAYLEELAKKYGWTRGAELGVWYGKTFFRFLENVPGLTMIGVDNWSRVTPPPTHHIDQHANRDYVISEAEKYHGRAIIMEMDMSKASALIDDESLDFIFIDGDHTYESAKRDILLWMPKVKKTGWITGHDYLYPSVKVAVDELLSPVNCPYGLTDETWARPVNLAGKGVVTICCIKQGVKYCPEYVNVLYSMVQRNVHLAAYDFVCFTEDARGVDPRIRIEPLPAGNFPGWWQKLGLFKKKIKGIRTEKILFFDLDIVITGFVDRLLEFNSDFAICRDWPPEMKPFDNSYNSSVFLLRVGSRAQVWKNFSMEAMPPGGCGDQDWIYKQAPDADLFPYDWTPSYRLRQLQHGKPENAMAVIFHGDPKPDKCNGWHREYWK
jgi:hypothetical protein